MKLAIYLLLANASLIEAARLQASEAAGLQATDDMVVNMAMNGDGNTVNFNPSS